MSYSISLLTNKSANINSSYSFSNMSVSEVCCITYLFCVEDGKIDFKQFIQLIERHILQQKMATPCHNSAVGGWSHADLQFMFATFDKDKNGYIDATELKRTMKELGLPLSESDVNHMLQEAGGHGRIYYEGDIFISVFLT